MGQHALLDVASAATKASGDVFDHDSTHSVIVDFAEELTGLLVVGVRVVMGISADSSSFNFLSGPGIALVFGGTVE